MKEFLKKIKLIDYMTTNLQISTYEFVDKLRAIVDTSDFGFFLNTFDAFSSSSNEFKGQVSSSGFKIKRRKRFFDANINFAVATGTFSEHNRSLIIKTEIDGFSGFIFIPFYLFVIIFYTTAFYGIAHSNGSAFFGFPFLIFHAALMFAIPYFSRGRE